MHAVAKPKVKRMGASAQVTARCSWTWTPQRQGTGTAVRPSTTGAWRLWTRMVFNQHHPEHLTIRVGQFASSPPYHVVQQRGCLAIDCCLHRQWPHCIGNCASRALVVAWQDVASLRFPAIIVCSHPNLVRALAGWHDEPVQACHYCSLNTTSSMTAGTLHPLHAAKLIPHLTALTCRNSSPLCKTRQSITCTWNHLPANAVLNPASRKHFEIFKPPYAARSDELKPFSCSVQL